MQPALRASAELYEVGNILYPQALAGLSRDELLRQPGDTNPMVWLAGHLVYCRCAVLRLAGVRREMPWPALFKRGAQLVEESSYPAIGEITELWEEISPVLAKRLEELTEEELGERSPHRFPVRDRSLLGGLSFMAYHESYHIGQMAYLRKWLGYEGLVG